MRKPAPGREPAVTKIQATLPHSENRKHAGQIWVRSARTCPACLMVLISGGFVAASFVSLILLRLSSDRLFFFQFCTMRRIFCDITTTTLSLKSPAQKTNSLVILTAHQAEDKPTPRQMPRRRAGEKKRRETMERHTCYVPQSIRLLSID